MVFAELSDTNYVGTLLSDFEYRPKRGTHFVLIHVLGGSTCSFNCDRRGKGCIPRKTSNASSIYQRIASSALHNMMQAV